MAVSAIGSSFIASSQKITSGTASGANTLASAAQEAAETRETTTREAQRGDPVAKRKLQQLLAKEQQQTEATPPKSTEPGKGALVDHPA